MTQSKAPSRLTRDDTVNLEGAGKARVELNNFDHASLPFEEEEWPVIIIGSSMVGMALGVLLGFHG
jgi:hypothetical protein